MPNAPQVLCDCFPGGDAEAIVHLERRGFQRAPNFSWKRPQLPGWDLSERDIDAINYLCLEWDWGGLED